MQNAYALAVKDAREPATQQAGEPSVVSPAMLFELLHALREVTDTLRTRWDRELRAGLPGINAARASTIIHTARRGVTSQVELARLVGVSQMTLTRLVDGLEKSGLVTRSVGLDRRVRSVQLTAEGQKMVAAIDLNIRDFVRSNFSATSEEWARALISQLGALR